MRQFGEKRRTVCCETLWPIDCCVSQSVNNAPWKYNDCPSPGPEFITGISPVQFVSILENLSISLVDYQFIKI